MKAVSPEKDYLWLNLKELPYFRALMRAQEASFYSQLELPSPTLHVGCGDGHFATVAFDQPVDVGIDPGEAPLKEASGRRAYRLLVQTEGGRMPFPDGYFGSAFSNSVLEHIPQVEAVLEETCRVLRLGAPFVFCGPNHRFLENLSIGKALDSFGMTPLGDRYRAFFNRISRHLHGQRTLVLADDDGQIFPAHSISAGLDYPGVGPEHAFLHESGRATYVSVTDDEALAAFQQLARIEGLLPALESAHAIAYLPKLATKLPKGALVIVNRSGRGDKDAPQVREILRARAAQRSGH